MNMKIEDFEIMAPVGSRVDLYLPIGTKVLVDMNQKTVGNETVIAKL